MKLNLNKETLSNLSEAESAEVVGGKSQGPYVATVCVCLKEEPSLNVPDNCKYTGNFTDNGCSL